MSQPMSQMKALVAADYGPLDQLAVTTVPRPVPGPGEVLIKVEAAALNPLDLGLVTGAMKEVFPVEHPLIVGMDAAGTVAEIGAGVTGYAQGDPVLAFAGTVGSVAEYTRVALGPHLARRPQGLSATSGAAIPESGMTATCLLRAVGLAQGENVLVIGATGGIGLYMVQLARLLGARVIATAPAEDAEYVRGLGAAETVDYRAGDVVQETLRLEPGGVDVVVDLINRGDALADSARAARPGGRVVSPLFGPPDLGRGVSGVYIGSFTAEPGDLQSLADRAASGELKVEIGASYPLADSVQAVSDFAGKHLRGKVVITIP
ncbi:NADPH2:quinone reductase [Streptacidiphilus sp. MAP12-16]|uniref:NADP-dependent oxidoreductase n=1 Tax=Streptacidiphilus sp. MAP12-16 TaxID=3156300 RepID=UPI003518FA4B